MSSLFLLAIGAFIGWNFPQPEYAKKLQAAIIAKVKSLFAK